VEGKVGGVGGFFEGAGGGLGASRRGGDFRERESHELLLLNNRNLGIYQVL